MALLPRPRGPRAVGPPYFAARQQTVSWVAGTANASLTFSGSASPAVVSPPRSAFYAKPRSLGPGSVGPTFFSTQRRPVYGWVDAGGSAVLTFSGSAAPAVFGPPRSAFYALPVVAGPHAAGPTFFASRQPVVAPAAAVVTNDTGTGALTFAGSAAPAVFGQPRSAFYSRPRTLGPAASGPTFFSTQPRIVTGWVADTGSGVLTFTGSAPATVKVTDTGSASLTFAGSAAVTVKTVGTGTGTLTFNVSATGGYFVYTAPFHGLPRVAGPRAAGPTFFANQPRRVTGSIADTASGVLTFAGAGAAVVKSVDTATGQLSFQGAATAKVRFNATATGALGFAGSANRSASGNLQFYAAAYPRVWPLPERGGRRGRVNGSKVTAVQQDAVVETVHAVDATIRVRVQISALAMVVGDSIEDEDLLVALVGV